MTYTLEVRKEAEADVSEAYQYYELCREGLGSDLLLCIEETFDRITKSPHHYQVVHKNVRRTLSRRFPYCVYYTINTGLPRLC